ncbi:MAG: hypothetical protein MUC36_01935 [Planctomycetes bacterium]|jgi:hypothetical protein|nr:hypothetical protein [Planctomycetota bacterium]
MHQLLHVGVVHLPLRVELRLTATRLPAVQTVQLIEVTGGQRAATQGLQTLQTNIAPQ